MKESESTSAPHEGVAIAEKVSLKGMRWLVPGEHTWEIRVPEAPSEVRPLDVIAAPPQAGITLVALSAKEVICQLFWLDTTDEKAVPDLLRMQCERRALLRQNEVWQYRIVRREAERLLVQVFVLQNTLPEGLLVEGEARFEALPRCLKLPGRTLCLWRSLDTMVLAITDDAGVLYFQSLPHQSITTECRRDIQAVLWLALAQNWMDSVDSVALFGSWTTGDARELSMLEVPVEMKGELELTLPVDSMELTPKKVLNLRTIRNRQRRVRLVALVAAVLYVAFLSFQIVAALLTTLSNTRLQSQLNGLLPEMTKLQATARRLDALTPALDTKTYPLEVLYRVMAVLPETGVRLTRFEIIGDRVELSGESSTAREAFDFLHALQSAETMRYINWEEPPQPVPLPNDTARFSIQGTITGAYHDAEES